MAKQMTLSLIGGALYGCLIAACGASQPTSELVDARRAYDQARSSNAAQIAPDKLLNAKQALDKAEAANADGDQEMEKSLAYIASRKAALAMSQANLAQAQQDMLSADEKYKQTQDALRKSAEAQAEKSQDALKANRDQLERVRRDLAAQGGKLSEQGKALQKQEAELAARQKELEAEKAARIEAEKKAAAALASLHEIARVKEEQRGLVITLDGSVLFASGKTALLPIAEQKLGKVAEVLQNQDDSKRIVVEGHTDSVGSDTANMQLSQARAESVRGFLVTKGVPSARISAVGKGESVPIADNKTPDGRANNRRVEIIVGN